MSIADELITRGWTQGDYERDGAVCLYGAALYATTGRLAPEADCLDERVVAVLHLLTDGQRAEWNDRPGRTFDEVLRLAKEADELLDAVTFDGREKE